jgi:hypothetical protein
MDTFHMESKLGTVATARSSSYVCQDFFAVLANVWVPNDGNCTQVLQKHREMFQVQNDQMNAMNSHLTVFTTWSPQELQDAQCTSLISSYSIQYPHVKLQQFDPQDLLTKHDALFNQTHIGWIKAWADTVPRERHAVTRLSDLFRLALQLEHHMTYIDLDVIFLNLDPTLYGRHPNVAAPVWSEEIWLSVARTSTHDRIPWEPKLTTSTTSPREIGGQSTELSCRYYCFCPQ